MCNRISDRLVPVNGLIIILNGHTARPLQRIGEFGPMCNRISDRLVLVNGLIIIVPAHHVPLSFKISTI